MSLGGMNEVAMTGLIETAQNSDPNTFAGAMPVRTMPEQKNWAEDENTLRFIREEIVPVLTWVRSNRGSLEQEWQAIDRMESLSHDSGRRYYGRSNAYIPLFMKNMNSMVSSLNRGLFPSDEYLDVVDRREKDQKKARLVKSYLQWEFERVANVRTKLKPFLRQFTKYGNGVMKFGYRKRGDAVKYTGKNEMSLEGMVPSFKPDYSCEGLWASARSIFNWYIYPLTCDGIPEATLLFEDIDVPRAHIRAMGERKEWTNIKQALEAPEISEHNNNRAEQLRNIAGLTASPEEMWGRYVADMRTVTEVWAMMPLGAGSYVDGEPEGTPVPVKIVLAGDVPLSVRRNPEWHQRPPYLFTRQNVSPGSVYGYGMGRSSRALQYLTNDFANQTNDCGMYGLNPIVKVNPTMLAGPLRPMAPGAVWPMTDVNQGAVFDRPPIEQVGYGMQLTAAMIAWSQDFNGTPPIMQGTNAGKGAKTATSSQILQSNSMRPIQDVVEDIELEVLIPLLQGAWVNAQQYRSSEVMAMVAGERITVRPEDLAIDAEFRWLASSQAANQQQRSQQVMQLMQSIMPLMPAIAQQGYVVDFVPLIRRVYADGFGFRGFDEFIKRAQAAAGLPPGAPVPPGMVPGVAAEQGDRVRSAMEQVQGMEGAEMAPGEGEAFMEVRDNADSIAAMMGSI